MRILAVLLVLVLIPLVFAQGYFGNSILEGETKQLMLDDKMYTLLLVTVADTEQVAVFKVNGEMSKRLREKEKFVFSDGSTLFVSNIYPNEAAEKTGKDMVEFYFLGTGGSLAKPQVTQQDSPEGYDEVVGLIESLGGGTSEEIITPKGAFECLIDQECNDKDGCTADGCIGGACVHTTQGGCAFDEQVCVVYNTRMSVKGIPRYCGSDGSWKQQGIVGATCLNNQECTTNICTGGECAPLPEEHVAQIPTKTLPSTQRAEPRRVEAPPPVEKPVLIAKPPPKTQPLPETEKKIIFEPAPEQEGFSVVGFIRWLWSRVFG